MHLIHLFGWLKVVLDESTLRPVAVYSLIEAIPPGDAPASYLAAAIRSAENAAISQGF